VNFRKEQSMMEASEREKCFFLHAHTQASRESVIGGVYDDMHSPSGHALHR